jgi:RNA polymerase sigma-70 factor (ECF subfamily)
MENQTIIQAARNGDKKALTSLLIDHRNLIASVVCRCVYDEESRRDVVQDIVYKVIKQFNSYNGSCKFSTWLYRIAMNEAIDFNRSKLRSKKRYTTIESQSDIFQDLNAIDGLDAYTKKEISTAINETVNNLPLDQKTAFTLFYFCGYKGKDASEVLKISEENFFMKLKAARDKVRKALLAKGWQL